MKILQMIFNIGNNNKITWEWDNDSELAISFWQSRNSIAIPDSDFILNLCTMEVSHSILSNVDQISVNRSQKIDLFVFLQMRNEKVLRLVRCK